MADSPFCDLDHYVAHPRIGGLALSPDGTRLVTTVQTLNTKKNGYVTSIWEVDPAGEQPARRLTRSAKGEAGPVFAANGDLYFTSARPDEDGEEEDSALWCLPAAGGEAYVVNRRAGGVSGVIAAARADLVAVTAPLLPGAANEDDQEKLHKARKEASVQAILHDSYPVRYWDHDLGPARPSLFTLEQEPTQHSEPPAGSGQRRLNHVLKGIGARFGGDVHISPDGSFALFALRLPDAGADLRSTVGRVDLATGEWEILFDGAEHTYTPGIISPDGTSAVIGVANRPTPERAMRPVLHLLDLQTRQLTPLTENADLWLTPTAWLPDGSGFLVVADQNGRAPVFRVDTDQPRTVQITQDDAAYTHAFPTPDGKTAYGLRSSYAFPAEVVRIDLSTGESTRLPNPTERPELPGTLEDVQTTAEDGVVIRSWLCLPEGASGAKPAPLLLWIHGGPLNSWNAWTWRWNPWLAVEQGYAVLLPDPALSTGYGQDFIQRGWNSWGDKPYTDLMSATDAALAREDIDQSRTAAMGGSFGGYMANWVAGHTDRFNAIVTHASLWALDQFGPTTDMSPFWRRQINAEMEAEHSPHAHVEKIVTPMLVIHGDKDYRVPIGEGLRLWYELLERSGLPMDSEGETAHRFLYFPDENHWILKPQHAKIWYQVVFAFLAEHVLGVSAQLPAQLGLTAPESEKDDDAA
ncbi:S9 family peptidase [Nesterenkonia alkaliphila]|uniref:Alpha/beta fold hydrolase n=1 Tax=Nesterenkonia alkaliphila TaxID=1463631 RepID=A0A7K1UFU4_9MICC|nr:alpha/beta fold hydrolase [Nesterenkonia alkaliphila]MVT25302.1 alpha/beta fold hydrolase [Nesterenkonia alkaliphila]GFZ81930.1 peptidase S9 [Nesterenkonia alkaliphila]